MSIYLVLKQRFMMFSLEGINILLGASNIIFTNIRGASA